MLLFKDFFYTCRQDEAARSTHKVGRIHDPILNWMSTIKREFQDLLLFLAPLLPHHLLLLLQEEIVIAAKLSCHFKTQCHRLASHGVLNAVENH